MIGLFKKIPVSLNHQDQQIWRHRAYINKPQPYRDLKGNIRANLGLETLRHVMENVLEQAMTYQQQNGGYLGDVIFDI